MPPKICCSKADWFISDAGKHGLALVVADIGGTKVFQLQARSKDKVEPTEGFIASISIKHCPFCGCDLRAWSESHREMMKELAERHRHLNEGLEFLGPQKG